MRPNTITQLYVIPHLNIKVKPDDLAQYVCLCLHYLVNNGIVQVDPDCTFVRVPFLARQSIGVHYL